MQLKPFGLPIFSKVKKKVKNLHIQVIAGICNKKKGRKAIETHNNKILNFTFLVA